MPFTKYGFKRHAQAFKRRTSLLPSGLIVVVLIFITQLN